MNSMKFLKSFSLLLVFTFLFSACGLLDGGSDSDLESVLPSDVSLVMSFDAYDSAEFAQFEDVMSRFPDFKLAELIENAMDPYGMMAEEEKAEAEAFIDQMHGVFDFQWRALVGVANVSEDMEDADVYIAGQFEKSDEFEILFKDILEDKNSLSLEESLEGGVVYWSDEGQDFYAMKDNDIFVISNSKEALDAAAGRLNGGESFSASSVGVDKNALGYVYADLDFMSVFLEGFYAEMDVDTSSMMDMYTILVTLSANKSGLALNTSQKLFADNYLDSGDFGDLSKTISFIDSVPGEGVFFYSEANVQTVVSGFVQGFTQESGMSSDELLDMVSEVLGVKSEDFASLKDSNFAMLGADSGSFLPAFDLYFSLDDDAAVSVANSLNDALTENVDVFIEELNAEMAQNTAYGLEDSEAAAGVKELFKRDTVKVSNSDLNRVYLDVMAASDELAMVEMMIPDFNFDLLKVEFYYGVIDDEMFVLAFHPDFADAYAAGSLGDSADYKDAISKLSKKPGYSVAYMASGPFVDLVDRLYTVGITAAKASIPEEEIQKVKDNYDLYFKKGFGAVKYVISSASYENSVLSSEAVFVIEEVK